MGIELSTTYALYHLIIKIALLFLFSEEEVHAQKNNLLQITRLVKGGDHIWIQDSDIRLPALKDSTMLSLYLSCIEAMWIIENSFLEEMVYFLQGYYK